MSEIKVWAGRAPSEALGGSVPASPCMAAGKLGCSMASSCVTPIPTSLFMWPPPCMHACASASACAQTSHFIKTNWGQMTSL